MKRVNWRVLGGGGSKLLKGGGAAAGVEEEFVCLVAANIFMDDGDGVLFEDGAGSTNVILADLRAGLKRLTEINHFGSAKNLCLEPVGRNSFFIEQLVDHEVDRAVNKAGAFIKVRAMAVFGSHAVAHGSNSALRVEEADGHAGAQSGGEHSRVICNKEIPRFKVQTRQWSAVGQTRMCSCSVHMFQVVSMNGDDRLPKPVTLYLSSEQMGNPEKIRNDPVKL